MTKQAEVTWVNIDVESLTTEQQEAYQDYKETQREAAKRRATFEDMVTDSLDVPQGKRVVFGYRFEKLSAALVDDDRKPSKAKQATATLAGFLEVQQANGRRI